MVFGPDDQRVAELTLCFFPHISEFIVVDARSGLTGRPRITVLKAAEVLNDDFMSRVEKDFSRLLRRTDQPFMHLMGLPQEVEGLVRMHGLRAILEQIGDSPALQGDELNSTVAVFFCTGPFLSLNSDRMRQAVANMFGTVLSGEHLNACSDAIIRLAGQERGASGRTSGADLSGLIRGDTDGYATLWQNGERQ